jgi:gamma-glutamyltranspeptidase / glutathione hydrolase
MVATSQPLASQAGLSILMQGGNAADAAVAAAAALNVTEPGSTGIGGDMFALYFDAKTRSISALNGSGRAPMALTVDHARAADITRDPRHAHCVTVPGAAAGWCDFLDRHGSMPMAAVLAPAIRLAEDGFPVAPLSSHSWVFAASTGLLDRGRELTLNGRGPNPGEWFRNPGLARTFRTLAEGGADAYYRGDIAAAIARTVQQHGGVMTEADLAAHRSTWETPISTTYRGHVVHECPPNGQGLTALIALNILEALPASEAGSLARMHNTIEALRLAFADAKWFIADPATNPAPLATLLDKGYARQRAAQIDPTRAMADVVHGRPVAGSDTVYFCVVDGAGNAASFINSNYMGFGSGIVPDGWGFSLQNRGRNFNLEDGHPNQLAPGKRPYHTIIPAMITRADGSLYAPYGVMGGFMQPQGHVQVAQALLDDGLDPQAALDAPRLCLDDDMPHGTCLLEEGLGSMFDGLTGRGHTVRMVSGHDRGVFGRGQIIVRQPDGVLIGGSDPRADGCAMGF